MTTGAAPATAAGRALASWILQHEGPDALLSPGEAVAQVEAEARQQVDTDDAYKRGYHDGVDAGEAQERERVRAALFASNLTDEDWAPADRALLAILDAPAGDHGTDVPGPGEQK